jgi:hypothetical protein
MQNGSTRGGIVLLKLILQVGPYMSSQSQSFEAFLLNSHAQRSFSFR